MKFRIGARHWLVGGLLCLGWGMWPRPGLPEGSVMLETQPPGARVSVLQTSTRLPGIGSGGGASLRPVGSSPGPLQLSGADFPAVLVIQLAGCESQQLEVGHIGQLARLHPRLQAHHAGVTLYYWVRERPWVVGLLTCLLLGARAWRQERQTRLQEEAALRRLAQGLVEGGDQIAAYRVEKLLGAGGMGVVYRCTTREGDRVSLKLLKRQSLEDRAARARLAREAESCMALRHPGLLFLLDWGEYHGLPYLAYEFVEGEPLDKYIETLEGEARQRWVAGLGVALAEALSYLHERSIVHRDLKPSNVLIDHQGRPRLMDFGIASLLGRGGAVTSIMGTPGYIAPEILQQQPFDAKVDGYALAALMYWAFSGRAAFAGQTPVEIMQAQSDGRVDSWEGIPPAYEEVLSHWLQPDPRLRGSRPEMAMGSVYARLANQCYSECK